MTNTKMCRTLLTLAIVFAADLHAQRSAANHNPGTFAVPRVIRYSNTFPGEAPTGAAGVIFSIYREQYDGAPLWSEIQNVQAGQHGAYSVLLGSTRNEGLPLDIFTAAEPRWLEVEINGVKEPRVRVGSVPYALVAGNAETLGGYPASAFQRVPDASAPSNGSNNSTANTVVVPGGVTPAVTNGSQNYLAMFSNSTDLVNSVVYQTGNAVSIGGTTSLGAMTLIGNTPFGDAAGMALYNAGGGSGASVSLDMYNTSFNSGIPQAKIKALDDGNYSDHLTFWLKNPGASTNPAVERMRITSSGNVGIGTSTPAAMLEVNGAVKVDGGVTVSGSGNSIVFADGSTLSTGNIPAPSSPSGNLAAIAGLRWGYTINSNFNTGTAPSGVAFDGANIWVTNSATNNVTKIQTATGTIAGTFTVGNTPRGICFDGTNIWVANTGANTVTKLLASSGAAVGAYPAGSGPYGIAFDGANIWVSNSTGNSVTELLASTGATLGSYPVGAIPYGVAFDGLNIWVANSGASTVTKLLASNGALIGSYKVGTAPQNVAFDGTNIWVTGGTLAELSAANGATAASYPIAGVGIAFDGTNMWVTQPAANTVTKVLVSTGATIGAYTVGTSPAGIAFDGSNMWAANTGSNNVTQILPSAQ